MFKAVQNHPLWVNGCEYRSGLYLTMIINVGTLKTVPLLDVILPLLSGTHLGLRHQVAAINEKTNSSPDLVG